MLYEVITMLEEKDGILDIVHGNAPLVPANDPGDTRITSYNVCYTKLLR